MEHSGILTNQPPTRMFGPAQITGAALSDKSAMFNDPHPAVARNGHPPGLHFPQCRGGAFHTQINPDRCHHAPSASSVSKGCTTNSSRWEIVMPSTLRTG